jgi:hypothetical protein
MTVTIHSKVFSSWPKGFKAVTKRRLHLFLVCPLCNGKTICRRLFFPQKVSKGTVPYAFWQCSDPQAHFSAPSNERRKIMSAPLSKELRKQYKVRVPILYCLSPRCYFIQWFQTVSNFRSALFLSAKTMKSSLQEVLIKVVRVELPPSTARNGSSTSSV